MKNREEKLKAARRLLAADKPESLDWYYASCEVFAIPGPSSSPGIRALSFALEALDETEAELAAAKAERDALFDRYSDEVEGYLARIKRLSILEEELKDCRERLAELELLAKLPK